VDKGAYLLLLNVDLDKLDTWVFLLHLGEVGRDHLAWSTPSCPEVDNNRLVTVDLDISLSLILRLGLTYESLELVV